MLLKNKKSKMMEMTNIKSRTAALVGAPGMMEGDAFCLKLGRECMELFITLLILFVQYSKYLTVFFSNEDQ